MAKRIERIDIHDNNLFEGIKKGASEAEKEVEALAKVLDLLSKELDEINKKGKSITLGGSVTDVESLKKANEQNIIAQKLAKQRAEVDKHSLLTKQQMQSAEQALQRQREKAINQLEKEKKRIEESDRRRAIQEEKAHAQREKRYNKEIEQANKAGAEYSRFRKELNKLENQYRDLAIQGRETTDEGVKLLNQITKMRAVSDNANTSIRRFNDSVGDYEGSIRRAADALRLEQKQIINNINIVKNQQKTYSQSSVEFKLYQTELNKYETRLKQVNNTLNNTSETTNNFSKSFGKLSGALGVLGVGLSVGAGLKSAFDTIKNFDEANADMAKTLGISTEEAGKLSMEFTKLGSVTSIQGLQEIATIGGQFGISATEIGGFVSSMDKLNVALGSDFGGVEETAKQLGAMRNMFTDIKSQNIDKDLLGIGNALNELSSKGAKVEIVSDFANRISGLAIPLGVTSGEVLGLSATLANLNVNAERGGTAVGTIFQRMTQDASGFAEVAGVSTEEFTNLLNTDMVGAFKLVAKSFDGMKGDNVLMSKTLESLKLTGSGASEVFLKMASNTELLDANIKLSTDSLKEQDSILQEVDKKSSTVGASVAKLGNAWDNFVLGVNEGTGAQNGIITFFDFVAKNLPTIISTLAKLTAGFVAYRTAIAVANTDFKALLSNFTKLKTDATEAGGKLSGFGNALKGVGWSVAIGFAIELGTKIYDIASGAQYAAEKMARFNKAMADGQKFGQKLTGDLVKRFEKEKTLLDLRLSLGEDKGGITEKQYELELKELEKGQKARLKFEIQTENENKEREKKRMAMLQSLYDKAINTNPLLRSDLMTKVINKYDASNASLQKSNATLKELYALNNSLKEQAMYNEIAKNTSATNTNTGATNANTKAKKENKKEMKDASDQINELIESMRNLDQFLSDAKIEENTKQFEQALQTQFDEIAKNGEYSIDLLTDLIEKERQYRLAVIERTFEQEKAGAKNNVDLELAELKRNKAIQDLDEEMVNKRKETNKKLEEAQEDYAQKQAEIEKKAKDEADEKRKKDEEKEKESLEKRRKAREEFVNGVIDEMKRLSEEEESKIDSRIEAEKKLQSELIDQANAGNISAQQSIEASKKAEQQATLDKMKEQKKQQALDDIKTLYNVINQNIEKGDNVEVATTKAVGSMALIKSIAKLFQGFASGTEWRLGDENKALFGGVDGHIIRADSSEGIVRGDLMDKAERHGITSIDEMVNRAILFQKVPSDFYKMNDNRLAFVPVTQSNNIDILPLIKEVKELRKEIKNSQSQFSIDPYVINGIARGVTSTERKGNDIRKTLFKA